MAKIKKIIGRQVFDSRGNPTVEAELFSEIGSSLAIVPSGASTGTHEAYELRDNDQNNFRKEFQIVNLENIDALGLDAVDAKILMEKGLIRSSLKPVKILGNGELNSKINITATSFSTTAKQKIEKAGGTAI